MIPGWLRRIAPGWPPWRQGGLTPAQEERLREALRGCAAGKGGVMTADPEAAEAEGGTPGYRHRFTPYARDPAVCHHCGAGEAARGHFPVSEPEPEAPEPEAEAEADPAPGPQPGTVLGYAVALPGGGRPRLDCASVLGRQEAEAVAAGLAGMPGGWGAAACEVRAAGPGPDSGVLGYAVARLGASGTYLTHADLMGRGQAEAEAADWKRLSAHWEPVVCEIRVAR